MSFKISDNEHNDNLIELRKQAGGKTAQKKVVYEMYVQFIDDLIKAHQRGEATLPDDLLSRLGLLSFNDSLTKELKPSAPKRWTEDLQRLLVIEVDKLIEKKEVSSIKKACIKVRDTALFGNLKPTDTQYYDWKNR